MYEKNNRNETHPLRRAALAGSLAVASVVATRCGYDTENSPAPIAVEKTAPDTPIVAETFDFACPPGSEYSATFWMYEDKNSNIPLLVGGYLDGVLVGEAKESMVLVNEEGTPTGEDINSAGPGYIVVYCEPDLPFFEPQGPPATATKSPE